MNRKLHHAITALMTSAAVLVLGLVAAAPMLLPASVGASAPQAHPSGSSQMSQAAHRAAAAVTIPSLPPQVQANTTAIESLADVANAAAEVAAATALVDALQQIDAAAGRSSETEPQRAARTSTRRKRQSFVMPYFSFAPRG